jgi:hypothetical protein
MKEIIQWLLNSPDAIWISLGLPISAFFHGMWSSRDPLSKVGRGFMQLLGIVSHPVIAVPTGMAWGGLLIVNVVTTMRAIIGIEPPIVVLDRSESLTLSVMAIMGVFGGVIMGWYAYISFYLRRHGKRD